MNAVDVLKYAHRTMEQSLKDLPEETWLTSGVCGIWSVKDILAHLASFEHLLVDVAISLTNRAPTLTLQRYLSDPAFNDDEVNKRCGSSFSQIWEEYASTHAHTLELIDHLPPEMRRQPGLLPWYGEEYDLEDFIAYSYYGHKREHAAQINVFIDYLRGVAPGSAVSTDRQEA